MQWHPTTLMKDVRLVRSKDVAQWYGQVVVAWDSLPSVTDAKWAPRWRNLGYWTPATLTYDDACRDLAVMLADAGQVAHGNDTLDVGCGSGASTYLLADRLQDEGKLGSRLVGLDLTPEHVAHARTRDYEPHPEFIEGSAVDLPFPDGSFDRVLALECAFHFPSRTRFFAQAHRVLRDGGIIATADVVSTPGFSRLMRASEHLPARVGQPLHRLAADILKMPTANLVDLRTYLDQLRQAGFTIRGVQDITAQVFPYFSRYWRDLWNPERQKDLLKMKGGLTQDAAADWARAWAWQMSVLKFGWRSSRYVIVAAERTPSASPGRLT